MGNYPRLHSLLFWVLLIIVPAMVVMESCSTSKSVVSHRLIQKRKYTKGWHFNSNHHQRTAGANAPEEKYRASNETIEQEIDPGSEINQLEKDTAQHYSIKETLTEVINQMVNSSLDRRTFAVKQKDENKHTTRTRSQWIKGTSKFIPAPVTAMTVDEKGQLFAFIALMVSLLLITGFLMHLIGPWTIADAGLVVMWILLLMFAAIAVVKNESEVYRDNLRPLFRASNVFMHWFFRVFLVLLIVAACLFVLGLLIAFIVYLMGIANLVINTFGLVIGIIVTVLLSVSGALYFLEIYPELFWIEFGALLLGVLFYSLYLASPIYLVLAVLGYVFLIAGAGLAIVHIVLSIIELS